jgi:hypothetical protein
MANTRLTKLDNFKVPVIKISWQAYIDIWNIVNIHKDEVGWYGEISKDEENGIYTIEKVVLPFQEVNGTKTLIPPEEIFDITVKRREIDVDKFGYWGHSHGSMSSVSPSGQDDEQMIFFSKHNTVFIGTIHNLNGDIHGYAVDKRTGLFYKDIPVIVEKPEELNEYYNQIDELHAKIDELEWRVEEEYEKISKDYAAKSTDWVALSKTRLKKFKYQSKSKKGNTYFGTGGGNYTPIGESSTQKVAKTIYETCPENAGILPSGMGSIHG